MRISVWFLSLMVLALVPPVSAGTANDPEIRDEPADSLIYTGVVLPHIEITKAWIEPKGADFHFTIEIGSMPDLIDLPKNSVYIFHYSWQDARFYWRANWTADGSEFEYIGGIYEGCKPVYDSQGRMVPPSCASHDDEGNRQYLYFPSGNYSALRASLSGDTKPGAPGRITWVYPQDSYGEHREGLTFKGLFVTTYERDSTGRLRYIDTAVGDQDYVHKIYKPWWSKLVPGPSPLLLVGAIVATLAVAARRRTP